MTTKEIYTHAFEILHREEKPVALKYSLRHAIMELGPSGFPFEDFVAEIFRAKGFEAKTGQVVKGFCVEHEIDVVAWNEEKLIMVEAKLHPLTCLTSLNGREKKVLLDQGIVLCKTLRDNPDLLNTLGFKENEIVKVMEEIKTL